MSEGNDLFLPSPPPLSGGRGAMHSMMAVYTSEDGVGLGDRGVVHFNEWQMSESCQSYSWPLWNGTTTINLCSIGVLSIPLTCILVTRELWILLQTNKGRQLFFCLELCRGWVTGVLLLHSLNCRTNFVCYTIGQQITILKKLSA